MECFKQLYLFKYSALVVKRQQPIFSLDLVLGVHTDLHPVLDEVAK
jgi:hypothetical protein